MCPMIRIEQYKSGDTVPALRPGIFFHSEHFFRLLEKSSGITPVLLVAYDAQRVVVLQSSFDARF